MRRFILCLLLTVLGATARADWQTFLRDEPTTQKRDDRVFTTLEPTAPTSGSTRR